MFQRFTASANQIACRDGGGNGVCGDPDDVAYGYDAANRLISVTDGASTNSYAYNGDGDRVSQTVAGVTTSYVIDTATPLTMVLAETTGSETIYYLHGLDLVAQNDGTTTEYFGYDALGSVRQMWDSAGSVLFAKVFDPYGNPYASAGTASTSWGFTGEQEDSSGMVYLRSRYYNPGIGRFQSRDVWHSDYNQPLSLNPWLYAYNNPVNLTDPSGKVPLCDQYQRADLTQWLIDEMNENRKHYIFTILWTAFHFPNYNNILTAGLPEYDIPADLASYGVALGLFIDVVKPNGLWDFKIRIFDIIGRNIQLTSQWYQYDVPGNVYFGFIGRAIGFPGWLLHCGADYANNGKPCSGSDPIDDYEAIEAGFDIYEEFKWGLVDENMIETALTKHQLIAKGQITEPNLESFSIPWPYPVGTFDDGSSGWIIKHR